MTQRFRLAAWSRAVRRQLAALKRLAQGANKRPRASTAPGKAGPRAPTRGPGVWEPGVALGPAGARRYRLYRPPDMPPGARLPLLVMLHGCQQDAAGFAASTRMNSFARREGFVVLYPEQDRLSHNQACWNWYGIDNGRAAREAASILQAIDQVCRWHPVDGRKVAIAGLSAGASMAALLVERQPERFKALVMHSGIAPGVAHSGLSALAAMRGRRTAPARAPVPGAGDAAWPPLLVIHGDADGVVSPANGRSAAEAWAQATGAQAVPSTTVRRGQRRAMTVTQFKRAGVTASALMAVHGLAHAWSGGAGKQPFGDARGPDASRLVWAFANQQFRNVEGAGLAAAVRVRHRTDPRLRSA
ncbi:extracellular catalytic domain type 1 short-chain-length polyhydroxyalkanoate depolymerase [Rubrivivax rivuli]|uniref:PHB depolymerase family esterase n=1 Tax=Rubrivivax rivuli TaxID=1862385 RepID=A0A437RRT3_9BURK|nr:PHB depolymerase family esterase [Rubrivivax rivuli]RVU49395.1 PHB depolymerase family esterase [Rubrivivax rivuli]